VDMYSSFAADVRQKQTSKQELDVEGRKVSVSNLDKVLYPGSGFTKGQVIEYYIRVSEYLWVIKIETARSRHGKRNPGLLERSDGEPQSRPHHCCWRGFKNACEVCRLLVDVHSITPLQTRRTDDEDHPVAASR
jgi:hypothetical protein